MKKIYEQNLTKKIYEIILNNGYMLISLKFAIVQAFTAPWTIKSGRMAIIFQLDLKSWYWCKIPSNLISAPLSQIPSLFSSNYALFKNDCHSAQFNRSGSCKSLDNSEFHRNWYENTFKHDSIDFLCHIFSIDFLKYLKVESTYKNQYIVLFPQRPILISTDSEHWDHNASSNIRYV